MTEASLLRRLGALFARSRGNSTAPPAPIDGPTLSVEQLAAAIRSTPAIPYDELDSVSGHRSPAFAQVLERIAREGWSAGSATLRIDTPPIAWTGVGNRSFTQHVHAWRPITQILMGSSTLPDADDRRRNLDLARDFAIDWIAVHMPTALRNGPEWASRDAGRHESSFAWYDMAVGERCYRLAYLFEAECRRTGPDAAVMARFHEALVFHLRVLAFEHFFRAHSNHGVYQALGMVSACRRFAGLDLWFARLRTLAEERLGAVIDAHFTSDDVHKEHSPGYHFLLLGSLLGARRTDLIADPHIDARLDSMETVLSWMVKPTWSLVALGDTDPRVVGSALPSDPEERAAALDQACRYRTPVMRAIATRGAIGALPEGGIKGFTEAGYAFARLWADDVDPTFENASYLAQMAGFHSRTHKHADHLSFVWHDRGRDILVDPGRFAYEGRTQPGTDLFERGFWYADPRRVYVESTHAHNCVEIDGKSYHRRRHAFFGSALRRAELIDGLAVTQCEMVHDGCIRHRRDLVMAPGHFLLVLDRLDDDTARHTWRQHFHFAPDWTVERRADGYRAYTTEDDREAATLLVFPLIVDMRATAVVSGCETPAMRGWISPDAGVLRPSPSIFFTMPDGRSTAFATLFVLGSATTPTADFGPDHEDYRIEWEDERGRHRLKITAETVYRTTDRLARSDLGHRRS